MRNYVVATHGTLAKALVESFTMIAGDEVKIHTVNAYVDDQDPSEEIDRLLNHLKKQGELFVFTDIFGGSVNNLMMKYIDDSTFVFTGVNLPLLLNIVLSEDEPLSSLIPRIKEEIKTSIIYCNEKLEEIQADESFEDDNF